MRVAVISDLHANAYALQRARRLMDSKDVERVCFLGDVAGYGPQIIETLQALQDLADKMPLEDVVGNHDLGLVGRWAPPRSVRRAETPAPGDADAPTAVPKLIEDDVNPRPAISWVAQQAVLRQQAPELWSWCQAQFVPAREGPRWLTVDDLSIGLVHGLLTAEPEGRFSYMHPWREGQLRQSLKALAARQGEARSVCLFTGHTHVPLFCCRSPEGALCHRPINYQAPVNLPEGPVVINPGSLGEPRTGEREGSFVILDTTNRQVQFRHVAHDWRTLRALDKLAKAPPPLGDAERQRLHDLLPDLWRQEKGDWSALVRDHWLKRQRQILTGAVVSPRFERNMPRVYARTDWGWEPVEAGGEWGCV
jgi:predicted phosphodiesterase